mgnify:CR=1 FL=1
MEGGSGRRDRTVLSEINVTPFVDVMLVLLVIFMVTAPLLQQGIEVNLPKELTKEAEVEETSIVTVTKKGDIYYNQRLISLVDLERHMELLAMRNGDADVYLRADEEVPYGVVVKVISRIKKAGIERLGMMTRPQ